jgi:sugar phosphate isomerase/epimerase
MNIPSARGGPSFGAHAFIWAGEWSREGAERVISGAASAGLDLVEIPLLDPETLDVEHTRALLDSYGIGCSCSLGLPTGCLKNSISPSIPTAPSAFWRRRWS